MGHCFVAILDKLSIHIIMSFRDTSLWAGVIMTNMPQVRAITASFTQRTFSLARVNVLFYYIDQGGEHRASSGSNGSYTHFDFTNPSLFPVYKAIGLMNFMVRYGMSSIHDHYQVINQYICMYTRLS